MCGIPLNLNNKKILITGASSGIGRQIAICLSKLKAELIINGRDKLELKKTKEYCKGNCDMIVGDITKEETISNLFNKELYKNKKLSGLVYSCGVIPTIPLRIISKQKIQEVFDVNIFSFFECVKNFIKQGISDCGAIVGISSIAAVQPEKCQSLYSATKAAMNIAVQSLALELAEKNIRINTVMPGVTRVIGEKSEEVESLSKRQLFGAVNPNEIAALVAYLLSDVSSSITGRAFYCDAGRLL